MYWVVCGLTTYTSEGSQTWKSTRWLPTFALDEHMLGITGDDHAQQLARAIVDPLGRFDSADVQLHVWRTEHP